MDGGQDQSEAYRGHRSTKADQVSRDVDKMNAHMASGTKRMMGHDKHNRADIDATTTTECGGDASTLARRRDNWMSRLRGSGTLRCCSNKFLPHRHRAAAWWTSEETRGHNTTSRACFHTNSFDRFRLTPTPTTSKDNNNNNMSSDEVAKAQTATPGGDTIFGKMLTGEIPCKFIYEDDKCVAFDDINPVAPVHFLVIPRKALTSLTDVVEEDKDILGHLIWAATKVAQSKGLASNGYRVVINNGRNGCQSVYHLHLHVIGGKQLGWPPC